ncbi:MAG TPA: DUF5995 family protein [Pyrinomonadaceae bacterium]|nr:DUF5995 family protein [Pyrinomonadaceae bacterium]
MSGTTVDQALIQITGSAVPQGIDDVIAVMEALDAALPGDDGLKWFNWLYLLVTKEVRDNPPAGGFNNPEWVTRLDVVFAQLYFAAVNRFLRGAGPTPSSWQALFEARHRPGVERIQFALAGINAHINHDLALALLQTNAELNLAPTLDGPEHQDFEHVNDILEAVLPQALMILAEGSVIGGIAQDTGKVGRLLAIWNVRQARDLAWDFADHLKGLGPLRRQLALVAQDKLTGVIGRSILLHV